jgi:LDH2 family malate/lactate/ureidoglycolate dehydrogenase
MSERDVVIRAEVLTDFASRLLEAAGAPVPKARLAADCLVDANLRGVDSHGVQLLTFYLERLGRGEVDPLADGRVISENGGCLVYDGENGLGQVVSDNCCGHAVRLGKEHGLSIVVARESNHFGAAAFWAKRISAEGLIGVVMCNTSPIVTPWQGREGRIGTNPICVSVPGDAGRPWLLDMATTTVAVGKIFKAFIEGEPQIPAGWAMDTSGVPTTDTHTAYHGLLMPLGGYKGSGLGLLVEILCGVLGGGAMSTAVGGVKTVGRPARNSQMFMGIDVRRFMPLDQFQERMRRLVAEVKSARPAQGYDEVLVAGDPEWRAEEIRRRDGVPVTEGVWEKLKEAALRLGVVVPTGAG